MRRATRLPQLVSRGFATKAPRVPKGLPKKSNWTGLPSPASKSTARVPSQSRRDDVDRHQVLSDNDTRIAGETSDPAAAPAAQANQEPSKVDLVSSALAENQSSDLVAPVRIPDDPDGVLGPDHPAMAVLNNSSLIIQRQIEMMNVFLGFEQANRYVIMNASGETIGYLAEQDHGIGSAMARQFFRTHRSFTTHIFDREEREVLRVCHRDDRCYTDIDEFYRYTDHLRTLTHT